MKTVSNTTPIISLSSIGKIEILKEIFQEIIIPQAVYDEIKAKKGYGYLEVDSSFIKIASIQKQKYNEIPLELLDIGEAQTIMLSKEINADASLSDNSVLQ